MAKLKGMFNGFWRYRYLLWNLVSRDFKLKYRRSVLGVLWSVLNPLLMCLVYWAVFSSLMDMRGSGIDNFPVFLMCGQLLFNFFNEATSSSMSSVLSAAPLLKKVYIPKYIFPLEKCCFAMVNCVFSFVALLLVMIFTGAPFHLTLLEALYPLITLFFFSLGVGLFLAAATVFFRDIMHIWSVFITALLYFSAIFYDPTQMTFPSAVQHAADHQAEPHVLVYHRLPPHPDVGHPAGPQHVCGLRHLRSGLHVGGRAHVPQNAGSFCAAYLRRGEEWNRSSKWTTCPCASTSPPKSTRA